MRKNVKEQERSGEQVSIASPELLRRRRQERRVERRRGEWCGERNSDVQGGGLNPFGVVLQFVLPAWRGAARAAVRDPLEVGRNAEEDIGLLESYEAVAADVLHPDLDLGGADFAGDMDDVDATTPARARGVRRRTARRMAGARLAVAIPMRAMVTTRNSMIPTLLSMG